MIPLALTGLVLSLIIIQARVTPKSATH
jgi:hypothetical protein